ncbi:DeoR family glycerol-3-phosphate regulon repressor [Angulomicrobium tetraedrale]|uniref:DeoR family glycerol-3-phosphate regulon repressor n=1 Tax=Ancylobacter tetraedralis TaxID=217068 RepID=A0A839ZFM5_9HYPH|nr:DeoR/GlpR family DNA-binding transcription regulator [Ancylobacter tetraedralis]MBB3773760.1 DeoR family glycerol-3-phosphate regulon repressor [Ancylobacter tetraedralis]
MSSSYRHEEIRKQLATTGRVRVDAIAAKLGVTTETIRRDLTELENRSLLRRVHGGAIPFNTGNEPPISDRTRIRAREKSEIGVVATTLLSDGMSIFVDAGSTQSAFVRAFRDRSNLTVTTNSLDIASTLVASPGIVVRLTPGILRRSDNATIGHDTVSYVERFAFDLAFLGIGACDSVLGWMDFDEDEAALRRAAYKLSARSVVLIDSSKFGRRAAVRTFDIDQSLIVVTEKTPTSDFFEVFTKKGLKILTPEERGISS